MRQNSSRIVTPFSVPAVAGDGRHPFPLAPDAVTALVRAALEEDGAHADITTIATVPAETSARASLVARQPGVICGVPLAVEAFRQLDPHVAIRIDAPDGTAVAAGAVVLHLSGRARGLLSAERTALNYAMHLSGIATATAALVAAVQGTRARVLDTRKTTPGWRVLEKYAVRCGGGTNHRADLRAAVLIKDNHLTIAGAQLAAAAEKARALAPPGTRIEVECDTRAQVEQALAAGADIVMLDNMTPDEMRACVTLVAGRAIVEASGRVRPETIRPIAETGVDWISSGAITHSAPALDLALDFD
ncbi:MAG: carboxylating nicotinate-nucleotide diphosphorylase [Gemmatimonadaceae bacterium]|nr:carboxylating nicotinate-nucleotide diphosphorylase [Gemmatimonadaceae bacterium]